MFWLLISIAYFSIGMAASTLVLKANAWALEIKYENAVEIPPKFHVPMMLAMALLWPILVVQFLIGVFKGWKRSRA